MGKIVRRAFSSKPMTAAQKKRLEKLAAMPDEKIDLMDVPRLGRYVLEERGAQSVLPAGEEAVDAAAGRGCSGVVAEERQGLADACECVVAGGDVGGCAEEGELGLAGGRDKPRIAHP